MGQIYRVIGVAWDDTNLHLIVFVTQNAIA